MSDLRIRIKVDADTGELIVTEKQIGKLTQTIEKATNKTRIFTRKFKENVDILAHGSQAMAGLSALYNGLTAPINDLTQRGIDYNKTLETMQIGISSLIAVNSDNVTTLGRSISAQEKFDLASVKSASVMEMLKQANRETSATLTQLTDGFQSALAPSLQAGLSIKQTVEYTKLMTQASGAMGVSMTQLSQELKSVVSGTIDINSVVATNLGITNKQINQAKEQGNLYEFLKEKLNDFAVAGGKVANSFDGAMSNMQDSLDELAGELTKPMFEELADEVQSLSNWFKEASGDIHDFMLQYRDVKNINTLDDITKKIKLLNKERKELIEKTTISDNVSGWTYSTAQGSMDKLYYEIEQLKKKKSKLLEAEKDDLKSKPKKQQQQTKQELNNKLRIREDFYIKLGELEKAWLEGSTKAKAEAQAKILGLSGKELENYISKYKDDFLSRFGTRSDVHKKLSLWEDYYIKLSDIEKAWLEGSAKVKAEENAKELELTDEQYNKYIDLYKKEFLDKYTKTTKKENKELTDEVENTWDRVSKNMFDSFNNNFFKALKGEFRSLKGFSQNTMNDLQSAIYNPIAKDISSSLSPFVVPSNNKVDTSKLSSNGFIQDDDGSWSRTLNGGTIKINNAGDIVSGASLLSSDNSLNSALSLGSTGTSALSLASSGWGLSNAWLMPSYGLGQLAGQAYTISPVLGSFFAGGANVAGGGSALGMGSTSSMLGGMGVGGLGGYAFGSLGDSLFGADTRAGNYGAIGGAVGSLFGGVGTIVGMALGSIIGGMFGKTKVTGTASGIDIFGQASSSYADGRHWGRTDYKKKSWFSSKTWSDYKYQSFSDQDIRLIENTISTYEYLLSQLGEFKNIYVDGGRFGSLENFLDQNVVKAFLNTQGTGEQVYDYWKAYAESLDQGINEVFADEISKYIQNVRSWENYLLERDSKVIDSLQNQLRNAEQDFENVKKMFDVTGLSLDNFQSKWEQSINSNLTPEELQKWEALGNALKEVTDRADQLRLAILDQFNREATFKEYMLQLNNSIVNEQINGLESIKQTAASLSAQLRSLANSTTGTIDTLSVAGLGSNETVDYYISRYNDLQSQFDSYFVGGELIDGKYNDLQSIYSTMQNITSSLAGALGNTTPNIAQSIKRNVIEQMEENRAVLNNNADALDVKIVSEQEDKLENTKVVTAVEALTESMNTYNNSIAQALNIDDLQLSDFWTDKSLMNSGDIKTFTEILKPETMAELDEYVNIFANLRWSDNPKELLSNLTDEQRNTTADVFNRLDFEGTNSSTQALIELGYKDIENALVSQLKANDKVGFYNGNYSDYVDFTSHLIKPEYPEYMESLGINKDTILSNEIASNLGIDNDLFKTFSKLGYNTINKIEEVTSIYATLTDIGKLSDKIEKAINIQYDGNNNRDDGSYFALSQDFSGWATRDLEANIDTELDNQLKALGLSKELIKLLVSTYKYESEALNTIITPFATGGVVTNIMNNLEGKGNDEVVSLLKKVVSLLEKQEKNTKKSTRNQERQNYDTTKIIIGTGQKAG